jgi:hypothetical protein
MSWFLLDRNFKLLEPYEGKLSRTVLRGERGSNAPDLPGIEELHAGSRRFHVQTIEYELLIQGFEKPEAGDNESFMTTAQILNYLKTYNVIQLSEKRMGEALHKAGFERIQKRINSKNPVYGYRIREVSPNPFLNRV